MARPMKLLLHALWLLPALALVAPVVAYQVPAVVGADEALIVLTGSMEPTLSPGDIVFVEPVAIDQVREGDVINFAPAVGASTTYTHRVVGIAHDQRGTVLTTQGDANEDPDPMQVSERVLHGRVTHVVPFYGKAIAWVIGRPVLPLLMVLASGVAIANEARNLFGRPEGSDADANETDLVGADTEPVPSPLAVEGREHRRLDEVGEEPANDVWVLPPRSAGPLAPLVAPVAPASAPAPSLQATPLSDEAARAWTRLVADAAEDDLDTLEEPLLEYLDEAPIAVSDGGAKGANGTDDEASVRSARINGAARKRALRAPPILPWAWGVDP